MLQVSVTQTLAKMAANVQLATLVTTAAPVAVDGQGKIVRLLLTHVPRFHV